jgi:cation diffusion facilitator CzcD-associated flavoprotein CzcO
MKICIVGAGVGGLQTAKILSDNNHECHIFESSSDVGGVWRENYEDYSLQVPSELYEFVDYKSNFKNGEFPSGKMVFEYIKKYVNNYNLYEKCNFHFEETVISISKHENWKIKTNIDSYDFDYCVIATGMYNNPYIPESILKYNPVHSSCFVDASICKDKKIVVVGGGKSAIDCAVSASKYSDDVTLLVRDVHWPVPRYILGFVPFKWGTYSRFGHSLLPKHWYIGKKQSFWHDFFAPVKNIVWSLLEIVFSFQFNLKDKPLLPLYKDLFNGGQILNYDYSNAIQSSKIKQMCTTCTKPVDDTLQEADIVVCGTGFKKSYNIFEDTIMSKLKIEKDGLWLYKNIIPHNINHLAFIGSEVSTFNNILTQYLQAQWLNKYITTEGLNDDSMLKYINRECEWKRSWMPESASRASIIQLHMTHYHDVLMNDMGKTPVNSRWWEMLFPISSNNYRNIFK